nr:hypothetical protein [Bacteroides sp. 224]
MLEDIDIEGSVVSIDAMGTQREIAEQIKAALDTQYFRKLLKI